MKFKMSKVSVKAGPESGLKEGEFLVYPSTFTREPDSYGDVVAKGAFAESIAAWNDSGNVLPGLFGHRMDDPDFFVASATEMGEDDHGWWVKGEFDLDSPKGPQVYRLVKSKRLNQLSFAYDVLDEGQVELVDGTKANELRKLNVHEFSFVPVGANQDTSVVAVKAATESLLKVDVESLSEDDIDSLRFTQEFLGSLILAAESIDDPEKASGEAEAKNDERNAKFDEPNVMPSVKHLGLIQITDAL